MVFSSDDELKRHFAIIHGDEMKMSKAQARARQGKIRQGKIRQGGVGWDKSGRKMGCGRGS